MEEVDADIWVLTECFTSRSPGDGYTGVFSPAHPARRPNTEERWASIWSRHPISLLDKPARHRRGTVSAMVHTPIGPVVVYGCVLAYMHEPTHDNGDRANAWEVHTAEVERQRSDWQKIRELHPDIPLIVAGDFNQARSGRPRSYGTDANRDAVSEGLREAGMVCLTEGDLVEARKIAEPSHVEHICATGDLRAVGPVQAWRRVNESGTRLSDHPTIAVDFSR
jgi:hypothetical protein